MKSEPHLTAALQIPLGAITVTMPPPAYVSQRNVEAVVGVPPGVYLALVRAPGFGPPVTRVGQLRFVATDALVAWIAAGAQMPVVEVSSGANETSVEEEARRAMGVEASSKAKRGRGGRR